MKSDCRLQSSIFEKNMKLQFWELGISNFGEMERLAKVARPDICVITNIGVAHLEHLKSREGILKAKTEIFRYMNPEGSIILNGDDDMLSTVHPANKIQPVLVWIKTRIFMLIRSSPAD